METRHVATRIRRTHSEEDVAIPPCHVYTITIEIIHDLRSFYPNQVERRFPRFAEAIIYAEVNLPANAIRVRIFFAHTRIMYDMCMELSETG